MPDQATTPERWLSVPGYEGRYDVSDRGRVRSLFANYDRLRASPLVLKLDLGPKGHARVSLSLSRRTQRHLVYRLMLLAFVGPCPAGMEACHWDDDATNNRLENLRWDTRVANKADAYRNGKTPRKLTPDHLAQASAMLSSGVSLRGVGRALGVTVSTIRKNVRAGRISGSRPQ